MGNCFGRQSAAQRAANWRATGIVALRDGGARVLPAAVLDISPSVRILDATNNRLTALPDAQLGWPQLQRLVLASNALTQLPGDTLAAMAGLRLLDLTANKLTALPAALQQLTRLEVLLLSGNSLLSLPPAAGKLASLKQLNVSHNQLSCLPEELGECSGLQELDASHNALTTLPASLAALAKLKVLQLDSNRVAALPPGLLAGCGQLHTLSLHSNPIKPAALAAADGWAEYEARRQGKYDKVIAGGALLSAGGLDEGVDRLLKTPSP